MGCGGSRSTDASAPQAQPAAAVVAPTASLTKKPEFPPGCKSMVCKYLTDEIFNQLKDVKDKHGYTLAELINSGVKNPNSSIGLYAGSPETYQAFAPLLDKVIEEYHGHKPTDKHVSNWNVAEANFPPLDQKYCVSTRIRFARNLADYPLGTKISKEQRREVEKLAQESFKKFEGEMAGEYYPLPGMKKEVQDQLIADHFLFKEGDKYLDAAGLNRDWPDGRGIFINKAKTFLIWVNEEDQFRVISMQPGGDIKAVFARLSHAHEIINKSAKFAQNDHLGAIATCPTNIGTGLRASIHVKVPLLSKDMALFEKIAAEHHVQIRGINGEHSESEGGIYDVSNKRRIGFSEVQLVNDMFNGVKAMIDKEKELEAKAH